MAAFLLASSFHCLAQPDTNAAPRRAEIGAHQKNFDELTPEEQQKLREKRAKFQELSPEEKARIQKHLKLWKELSPEQQENLRQLQQKLKNATPEQKADLQKKIDQFQQLPPEQQREIIHKKTRMRNRDTSQGPLAEPSPQLQKRVESQYDAIWDDLSPEHRRILTRMHQRAESTPPEQRAALEERLKKFDQLSPEAQKARLQKMADRRKKAIQDRKEKDQQDGRPSP